MDPASAPAVRVPARALPRIGAIGVWAVRKAASAPRSTTRAGADGEELPISPGVDQAAFRIVQESLTNVPRHAAAITAQVGLAYTRDRLTLTVSADGGTAPPPPAPSGGYGLVGMRERAQSAGGHPQARHRPEGGFAVTAELPIHS
ncbi:ATP-binding protein [Streptomyces mirabilis]|uniref:ATP-binding protein n=1 Tax=Streptomyces mirabilis TaxID=68239 RepID=UPI0036DC5D4A